MRNFIGLDRAIIGLLVVALGVMLLLDSTNYLQTDTPIFDTYWPSLLILWGLWGFIANGFRLRLGYTAILAVGVYFQLIQLNFWGWDAGQLWPLAVVAAGLFLLFARPRRRARRQHQRGRQRGSGDAPDEEPPTGDSGPEGGPSSRPNANSGAGRGRNARADNDSDTIRASHILGGGQERITSQNFQGGEISAILGGMELDLREAGLHEGRATLDATIVCGGLELRVPKSWRVNLQTTTLLGGTENRHEQPPPEDATGELTITGTVVCGGIEIRD